MSHTLLKLLKLSKQFPVLVHCVHTMATCDTDNDDSDRRKWREVFSFTLFSILLVFSGNVLVVFPVLLQSYMNSLLWVCCVFWVGTSFCKSSDKTDNRIVPVLTEIWKMKGISFFVPMLLLLILVVFIQSSKSRSSLNPDQATKNPVQISGRVSCIGMHSFSLIASVQFTG